MAYECNEFFVQAQIPRTFGASCPFSEDDLNEFMAAYDNKEVYIGEIEDEAQLLTSDLILEGLNFATIAHKVIWVGQFWYKFKTNEVENPDLTDRDKNNSVILKSHCKVARGLLATVFVILNHDQVTNTTPELAPPSPDFHSAPTRGRLSHQSLVRDLDH
ncbi:hypothetical protein TNCV_586411 [Trichonephila clavipes]|nr:hypothetical protein TNCV_586411 [Trichonephila clavipes]